MRLTERLSDNVLGALAPICGPVLRPLLVAALAAGLGLAPCAAVAQEFVELPQSIVPFGPSTVPDRMTVAAGGAAASVSRALGASFTHIISEGQD